MTSENENENIEKEIIENETIVLEETLITPQGYLRVPKAVKDKFGKPQNYPNPKWATLLNNEHGTLKLIYTINVHDIDIKNKEKKEVNE